MFLCLDKLVFMHLKSNLKKKYQCVFEGIAKQGDATLLNNIYTDLYITQEKQSLMDLITQFFPETKGLNLAKRNMYKVLFILDGLDEFRLPLNFEGNETWSDVSSPASLDVLLTNLIKGNLLPSALIWITTRPAAASKIPPDCIDRVTEIRGFNDAQKEEYFRKRFKDENQAKEIIDHNILEMKTNNDQKNNQADDASKTLQESNTEDTPKTLTQMYTHFLRFQIQQSRRKYDGEYTPDVSWDKDAILSLGKLAFQQLERNNVIFYESDLEACGIDVYKASVVFVHDSTEQENKNETLTDLLKTVVDKALESDNGHLDLFLRFLLGLSIQSNRLLLQGLLTQQDNNDQSKKEIVHYIKQKFEANLSPERSINLFYCLNELNDQTLVKDIQTHLNKGSLSSAELSPAQWSAMAFVLSDCSITEEGYKALASALRSNPSHLIELNLTGNDPGQSGVKQLSDLLQDPNCQFLGPDADEFCQYVTGIVGKNPLLLRELNLSECELGDTRVNQITALLQDKHCKLNTLM
uniref:FISNA domain-containing protein n=1 Tax=Sinocyclocheilus anshuiensis TaxID=1608454 RepID=A0A671KD69_9TELE